ncbi:hypothetical protein GCM10010218_23700 [Streptomyces mashuensis]|uniref:Uncharacterized protein n=1 Tax=Streptomyces mashuensis TaxID=33904 RepID=A0A919B1N9_9ACTN|nr:hypothetical protein GCM10010218_23700 [Streptomyces mashuensis]
MPSMQPLPAGSEEPRSPRALLVALATGYAAGYAAALGVTGSSIDSTTSTAVASAQGLIAAICWAFRQKR